MTPTDCIAKANELRAKARGLEETGELFVSTRCRTMASNLDLMADDRQDVRERGARMYEVNRADFEAYVNKTGRYAS